MATRAIILDFYVYFFKELIEYIFFFRYNHSGGFQRIFFKDHQSYNPGLKKSCFKGPLICNCGFLKILFNEQLCYYPGSFLRRTNIASVMDFYKYCIKEGLWFFNSRIFNNIFQGPPELLSWLSRTYLRKTFPKGHQNYSRGF